MLFAEQYARLLLVVHAILAATLVASSTHLVVWMRGFPRGAFQRLRAVRKFAVITASLYVATLVVGNVIYPVYKVQVRVGYLERPDTVVRDYQERIETGARLRARQAPALDNADVTPADATPGDAATADALARAAATLPRQAARVARWFDVKEHWVALGMALSIGCALALLVWNPRRHGAAVAPLLFLMALGASAAAWLGAIVGIVVSSFRAIGGPG